MNKNITDISYSWNNTDDEFVRAIISLRSFRLTNSISALYQIGNRRETSVCYRNWHNLPEYLLLAQDNQNTIDYLYDATGTKLQKITSSDRAAGLTTDYTGPFVYEDSKLAFIQTSEGRIIPDQDVYTYEYFLRVEAKRKSRNLGNHLGNTRVVFNEQGEVLQVEAKRKSRHFGDNSYYPFGGMMEGLNYTAGLVPENKYLYNGKEFQDDFGLDWYDYGARFYDAQLGRRHVVDPLSEKNHVQSGYAYASNNPLLFMDYMGLDTLNINIENQTIDRIEVKDSETHTFIVENGDETTTTTLEINDDGLVKFPASGEGFDRYGTEDEGGNHYFKPDAAAALFGLTTEMTNELDGFNVDFGDMSASDGTAPGGDHKTHGGPKGYSGECVDYRYLDKEGNSFQGYANNKKFNAWNNGYFLKKAGEWGFTKNYISNQSKVWGFNMRSGATGNIKTKFHPMNVNGKKIGGHGHHGHLTFIKD